MFILGEILGVELPHLPCEKMWVVPSVITFLNTFFFKYKANRFCYSSEIFTWIWPFCIHIIKIRWRSINQWSPGNGQNQNSLLVERQKWQYLTRAWPRKMSLALTREVNLDYAIVRQFSRGDEWIREGIPVPDCLGKEAFLIGILTSRGNLKDQLVLISATPVLWDKVICRDSGFTF